MAAQWAKRRSIWVDMLHEIYGLYNKPPLHYIRRVVWGATGWYFGADIQEAIARSKVANAALGGICACTVPEECRKNNILYVHVPRCGGLSVTKALYGHFRDHHTALFFRNVDRAFFASAFKFAIVREPIGRALSGYKFILNKGTADLALDRGWQIITKHIKTLDHYIGFLEEHSPRLHQLEYIMRPQVHFVTDEDGKLLVDKLFRLECDMEAVNSLFRSWGLTEVPHVNATPATSFRLDERQAERLSVLYAADVRMCEQLAAENPG